MSERKKTLEKLAQQTGMVDFSYSAIMRKLRKDSPEKVLPFMKAFKAAFDAAMNENLDEAEKAALMQSVQVVDMEEEIDSKDV